MYILGVDLGTTSMSALVYEINKGIIYKTSSQYELHTGYQGESEQNPHDWIDAFEEIIHRCTADISGFGEQLLGVSISGQMHSLVCLDQDNKVIRPAILWNDTRTSREVHTINKDLPLLNHETQNKALEGFTLPKLLWLKNNEPDNYSKLSTMLLPKDYLNYYLTGVKTQEETDAAGTILYNLQDREWSTKLIDHFDLKKDIFPSIVKTGTFLGNIRLELAKKLKLNPDVKVFAGAADNVASALGVGIFNDNQSMLSLGTSGVYLSLEKEFRFNDGNVHFFSYANDLYYSMGVTLAAGKSLSWFKELFYEKESYEEMMKKINLSPLGANRLLFTPYIQGERTPHTDANIRSSFIGLDVNHQKEDMLRSVVEGITFSLKDCQELIFENRDDFPQNLVVTGGGAQSEEWLQIIADIMNQNVQSVEVEEGAALGSVMIAGVSMGIFSDYNKAYQSLNTSKKTYYPKKDNVAKYQKLYRIYKKIYSHTCEISKDLLNF